MKTLIIKLVKTNIFVYYLKKIVINIFYEIAVLNISYFLNLFI